MSARTSTRSGWWLWLGTACIGCGGTVELGGRVPEHWFDGNAVDTVGTTSATTLYQGGSAALYAVDETTLYVALDDGQGSGIGRNMVWKACALSSCATTVRTLYRRANVQLSTSLSGLAIAGTEMFFTANDDLGWGIILACPVAGCEDQPRTLTTDIRSVRSLVADQEYVYWVDDSGSSVSRCAHAGCAAPETRNADVLHPNTIDAEMTTLALSDAYVYWVSFLRLHRIRRDFSADPEIFYESQLPLQGLAVGGGQIYFSVATLIGEVRRCPLTGCPSEPEIVATSQRWPAWLRGDDRAIYWITASPHDVLFRRGNLVGFSIQGSANSRTLASDILVEGQFWPLFINSHHLYWSDATGADVTDAMRIRTIAR